MFNKLKKALEDIIENGVQDIIDKVTDSDGFTNTSNTTLPDNSYAMFPSIDDEPFERVHKAEPVYPPITSLEVDDIAQLAEALDDPDPEQQVHAIQIARELMKQSEVNVNHLSWIVWDVLQNDPDAPARAAAAEALNILRFPENLSKTDPNDIETRGVWESRCNILAKIMTEDEDLLTRQNAAETLSMMGSDPHIKQTFIKLWHTEKGQLDPFIQVVASRHIGNYYLSKSLDDEARRQAKDALLQAYVDYPEARVMIQNILAQAKSDRIVPYLLKTYVESENLERRERENRRTNIIHVLGRIGSPKCLQPLLVLMQSEDKTIRRKAIEAIGMLENPDAIKPLRQFKASLPEKDSLHTTIDEALIKCGDLPDIRELKSTLKTGNVSEQVNAVRALSKVGGEEAIDTLIKFLNTTENTHLRGTTRDALANHASETVAHALIDAVCEGRLGYREVANDFMYKMKMSQAIKWLDKAVDERAKPLVKVKIDQDRNFLKNF